MDAYLISSSPWRGTKCSEGFQESLFQLSSRSCFGLPKLIRTHPLSARFQRGSSQGTPENTNKRKLQPLLFQTSLILPCSEPTLCRAPPAPSGHPWLSRWVQNRLFLVQVSLSDPWLSTGPTSNQANCPTTHPVSVNHHLESQSYNLPSHILLAAYKAYIPGPNLYESFHRPISQVR